MKPSFSNGFSYRFSYESPRSLPSLHHPRGLSDAEDTAIRPPQKRWNPVFLRNFRIDVIDSDEFHIFHWIFTYFTGFSYISLDFHIFHWMFIYFTGFVQGNWSKILSNFMVFSTVFQYFPSGFNAMGSPPCGPRLLAASQPGWFKILRSFPLNPGWFILL